MDLNAKLEGARRNVAALRETLAQKQREAANVNTMLVKWIGVTEYLESLVRDEAKAAEAAAETAAQAAQGKGAEDAAPEVSALSNGHQKAPRLEALPGGEDDGPAGGEAR